MKTLFHYCSNQSFQSIIENRSLRLSSLSLSNDSMEGKLVTELLVELAEADDLDKSHIGRIKHSVGALSGMIDGLGFCMSEEGDLLSQWRGYADDACGVAIGLSEKYLELLSEQQTDGGGTGFVLNKVEYDKELQKKLIFKTYSRIKELIDAGAWQVPGRHGLLDPRSADEIEADDEKIRKATKSYSAATYALLSKLFVLKTPAFKEEKEWRLISYFANSGDECGFFSRNNMIVPCRYFPIERLDNDAITEVVVGPKNLTPTYVIKNLLASNGFEGVSVVRSKASYR